MKMYHKYHVWLNTLLSVSKTVIVISSIIILQNQNIYQKNVSFG